MERGGREGIEERRFKIKIVAADVGSREKNSLSYLHPDPAVINMLHEILPEKEKEVKRDLDEDGRVGGS